MVTRTRKAASDLTKDELETLRSLLLAEQKELLGSGRAIAASEERQPEVGDSMDVAARVSEAEEAAARTERDTTRLTDIEHALARFERGEYGVSELSGEPIGFGRLSAIPWARFTVQEEEDLAKGA
jgi:DnaK suppressor protein